jgi:RNA polymerase sigma-70 factor (ECF subfamily)
MTDEKIIELLFRRDERALSEIESKYKSLLRYIADNFLSAREDVEECLNDVLISVWNAIPPEKPDDLRAYVSAAVRNCAIDKLRTNKADKRGGGFQTVSDEFLLMLDDGTDLASEFEARRAGEIINAFLTEQKSDARDIFVMSHYLGMSYAEIADVFGCSEGKIKMSLLRSRKKLAERLRKEGIFV